MTSTTYNSEASPASAVRSTNDIAASLEKFGEHAVRYSIVIVLAWIGAMKFSGYEAGAIQGLVASSPILSWLYSLASQQGASNLIGTIEIATAIAIAVGPVYRPAALVGAVAAIATFAITLTFLLTAPGWEGSLGGFPALSVVPGQFLLKDIVLLAASVFLLAKAMSSTK